MKHRSFFVAGLMLLSMVFSPVMQGGLYKWIDENGKIHYGDRPPENVKLKKIIGEVSSYSSVSVEPFVFDPNLITKRSRSKSVVMYSTSWCGVCKKAARHFRQKKIPFTEYDIEKSARAAQEYRRLNARGVPVILIGDQRMNGFSAKDFDRIYYGKT